VVQRPQHRDVGHHDNAAPLGGGDQAFHSNLPMRAVGLGRRQRQNINAGITQASKLSVACRNRIIKMAGPTCLLAPSALQITHRFFKRKVPPAACRRWLKVGDGHAGPRNACRSR
jgi:hypothetical protein